MSPTPLRGRLRKAYRGPGGGVGSVAEEFTCAVKEAYRSACEGLDFYAAHEGKRYCVLHFPDDEKKNQEDFLKVKKSKLARQDYDRQDYDFSGTFFPAEHRQTPHIPTPEQRGPWWRRWFQSR
jgi:hypothetical protein